MKFTELIFSLGNWFVRPFVFMKLYAWFIFANFGGPQLSYAEAFGVWLTVLFAQRTRVTQSDIDAPQQTKTVKQVANFAVAFIILGIGAIVRVFM